MIDNVDALPTRETFTGVLQLQPGTPFLYMPNSFYERAEYVSGRQLYRVYTFGVTSTGHKLCVIFDDIQVYTDVLVERYEPDVFLGAIKEKLTDFGYSFRKASLHRAYKLKGFQTEKSWWVRVHFNNLKDRRDALDWLTGEKYTTASDDASNYIALFTRELKYNSASWNRVSNWKWETDAITQNVAGCVAVGITNVTPLSESDISGSNDLVRDRSIVLDWDIETQSFGVQTGEAPRPGDKNFEIIMMSAVFSYQWSADTLLRVNVTSRPTAFPADATRDTHIIVVEDERSVIRTWAQVVRRMQVDFEVGFNTGNFDWPIVREQASRLGVLGDIRNAFACTQPGSKETPTNIYKWYFGNEKVKISAEEPDFEMLCSRFPGVLGSDCMVVFKQLYPTAETGKGNSLNFYLKMNKLSSKEDMDYKRMFRIFDLAKSLKDGEVNTDGLATRLDAYFAEGVTVKPPWFPADYQKKYGGRDPRDVILQESALTNWYCIIDAYRCRQLYVVRSIIDDKRELSNMSYVTLYDSFYRANGMKVRNLIGAYCKDVGIAFSNAKTANEKIKYPGAWVFPPKKGLNNRRPTVALDASSLYPSIMMGFNLSPDKVLVRRDDTRGKNGTEEVDRYAEKLRSQGYDLRPISFHCDAANVDVEGWTVHHRGNHTMDHTGAKIITGYEADGELLRHDPKTGAAIPIYGRDALPGESMGLFPFILKKLFDRRAALKKVFVALSKLKEKLERKDTITPKDLEGTGVAYPEYTDVCFRRNKVDSKQKAMKVHMNTFYGESGNFRSPIYELLVAGGITTMGQRSIKCVSGYLTSHGYDVRYGDTDSNYLCCPDSMFREVDDVYNENLGVVNGMCEPLPSYDRQHRPSYWRPLFDAHWKVINDMYTKIDREFEHRIKAGTPRLVYYTDRSAFTTALEYVKGEVTKASLDGSLDAARAAVEALRSRNREDYWIKMVQITRCDIERLRVLVNDHLTLDNGTEFIKMAYEEVLMPTVMTGKKKYFGFQHLEGENFHPKPSQFFIKGIDIIKQGQTDLAKEWGYGFIEEICSVDNYLDIDELVQERLRDVCSRTFELRHFVKNGKYKLPKEGKPGNATILPFVKRMAECRAMYKARGDPVTAALYPIVEPGDRLYWVVVKRDYTRDLRGRKVEPKISDKMEYVDVYKASLSTDHPLEIDLDYYLDSSIFGLFARFMSYKAEFEPPEKYDWDDKEQYKKYDDKVIKASKKWIEEFCEGLKTVTQPKEDNGRAYQRVYREINNAARVDLISRIGGSAFLIYGISWYDNKTEESNRTGVFSLPGKILDRVLAQFETMTEVSREYGREYVCDALAHNVTLESLRAMYMSEATKSLRDYVYEMCSDGIRDETESFGVRLPTLLTILERYERSVARVVNDVKNTRLEDFEVTPEMMGYINTLDPPDTAFLSEVFGVVVNLLTYLRTRKQVRSVCMAIIERISETARVNT